MRVRTTTTDDNGEPSLTTPPGSLAADLTHVVYTRDATGQATLYIDGVAVRSGQIEGTLDNWDPAYRLLVANEASGDRPWLGELYLAAIYDRALSESEVVQNYAAGPQTSAGPDAPAG